MKVRNLLAVLSTASLALTIAGPAATATPHRTDVVAEWFDVTANALAAEPNPAALATERAWAISWLAAARATQRVAYPKEAAFAAAVHRGLVMLVPSRSAELDQRLATTLSRIPRGTARDRAVAAGEREARDVLQARSGDRLDRASVEVPVALPKPAPGVWRPTPSGYLPGVLGGLSAAKPFALDRADRFRPGPPPELSSSRYRADLAEVRDFGANDSTVRTPEQTATAVFWVGANYPMMLQALRAAVTGTPATLTRQAGAVAIYFMAICDTLIATFEAKYAYMLWRPVTALREGGLPAWTPLHETPAHPDYPAAHATIAGASEWVLTAVTGPLTGRPVTIKSPTAPNADRTYTSWHTFSTENIDARVWSGVHTRTAGEVGVRLGQQVAAATVAKYARLLS